MDNQEKELIENVVEYTETSEVKELNLFAEKTLRAIANIVLILGIISTLVCLFSIVVVDSKNTYITHIDDKEFNPLGFATTIGILLGALIIWASLRVFSDISISLKEN